MMMLLPLPPPSLPTQFSYSTECIPSPLQQGHFCSYGNYCSQSWVWIYVLRIISSANKAGLLEIKDWTIAIGPLLLIYVPVCDRYQ